MGDRGEQTRELLVSTALRLFREEGYQATTMRKIATAAGVSQGNAYYYFSGKDELVHELYLTVQREHRDRALPLLREGAPLAQNLRAVMHACVDVMEPYHAFGGAFLHVALPSRSAMSPFSAGAGEAREMAIELMARVVSLSGRGPSAALKERLPELLWLANLAVTLHWVSDGSPDRRRTRTLVDGIAPIIARVVSLSRLPVARGLVTDVVGLMERLGVDGGDAGTPGADAPGGAAAEKEEAR